LALSFAGACSPARAIKEFTVFEVVYGSHHGRPFIVAVSGSLRVVIFVKGTLSSLPARAHGPHKWQTSANEAVSLDTSNSMVFRSRIKPNVQVHLSCLSHQGHSKGARNASKTSDNIASCAMGHRRTFLAAAFPPKPL